MDGKKFVDFMQKIKDAYGDRFQNLTDGVLGVWYECLGKLDDEKLNKSLINYMSKSEFPPTIADIRKGYDELVEIDEAKKLEVKRLYDITVSIYPGAHYEEGLYDVYMSIVSEYPLDKRIKLAQHILNKTAAYVKMVEAGTDEHIKPLAEYLKGGEWK